MSTNNDPKDAPAAVRLPKPESLEAKFKLLMLLLYDRRARRRHALAFAFLLDWFHSKYGDALVSISHIVATLKERDPAGKGLYAGDVHGALKDLVAWDFLQEKEKGKGRRASRYVPNWSLVCSVRQSPNTTEGDRSVLDSPNANVRESPNATRDSVRGSPKEDPSTPTRLRDPGTGMDGHIDCAAPVAPPPTSGLSAAAAAGPAQDPFEELYSTYGVRRAKAAARAAYEKLKPSAELHAKMIESAKAWRAGAGEIKGRMYLARWIKFEHYDENPPEVTYEPKERKPAKKAKPKSSEPTMPQRSTVSTFRKRAQVMDSHVVKRDVFNDAGSKGTVSVLHLVLCLHDDAEWIEHDIVLEHQFIHTEQEKGQEEFAQLRTALDIGDVQDSSELHVRPFILVRRSNGAFEYERAAANDQGRAAA